MLLKVALNVHNMSSVTNSLIFRHTFSTPASAAIWSDERRTQYYLEFEAALAEVQADLGIIPRKAAVAIRSKCDISLIDVQELGAGTVRVGYPVPLVKQWAGLVELGLSEWVHWGATTQVCGNGRAQSHKTKIYVLRDVTDTATVLQLRDTCNIVSESLNGIILALRALARDYAATSIPARSNSSAGHNHDLRIQNGKATSDLTASPATSVRDPSPFACT